MNIYTDLWLYCVCIPCSAVKTKIRIVPILVNDDTRVLGSGMTTQNVLLHFRKLIAQKYVRSQNYSL